MMVGRIMMIRKIKKISWTSIIILCHLITNFTMTVVMEQIVLKMYNILLKNTSFFSKTFSFFCKSSKWLRFSFTVASLFVILIASSQLHHSHFNINCESVNIELWYFATDLQCWKHHYPTIYNSSSYITLLGGCKKLNFVWNGLKPTFI